MKKLTLLLSCLVLIGTQLLFAQSVTITGKVTGKEDGAPLPGVSVQVRGTTVGTITNFEGKYSLNVPQATSSLVFSFVGMKSVEIPIENRTTIDVILEPEAQGINEVVVTSMAITKSQKSVGYSVATVKSDEISKSNQATLMNSLEGKYAGVIVTSGGGQPGASTKVILRGYSSITGNNNPLYIVDGTPIDNTSRTGNGVDFGNGANDINPDDVESVNILKGAAATSLYGSRAASGVIMITTKKGKSSDKILVSVTSNTTFSDVLRLPQNQNTYGTGWNAIDDLTQNGSWGPAFDGKVRKWGWVLNNSQQIKPYVALPSNIYDFYTTGKSYNNSIALSGGTENANFYMSYNNTTEDGVVPTDVDSHVRNAFSLKGEAKGKKLTFMATANYVKTHGKNPPDGTGNSNAANLYADLLQIPRDFSLVDAKNYNSLFNNSDNFFTPFAYNPWYSLAQVVSRFDENRIFGNFSLDYQIVKNLKLTWRTGIDITDFNRDDYEAILNFTPGSPSALGGKKPDPGYFSNYASTIGEINNDILLNYNKELSENLTLNVLVGYNVLDRTEKDIQNQVFTLDIPNFYNIKNSSSTPLLTPYQAERRLYGTLGSVDLSFKNYLFLTLNARRDWSSTLPLNNNHFDTYGFNLSFVLTDAIAGLKNDVLSYLKLRGSYGTAGNDASVYNIYPYFVPSSITIPYSTLEFPLNGVNAFEGGNKIGNPKLKPELTKEAEFGGDIRFFDGRVKLDISYYNRKTSDQILPVPIAPSSGYTTQVMNFGTVQNKGVEITFSVTPVKTENFDWTIGVTYSNNKNEVLELAPGLDQVLIARAYDIDFLAVKGQPLGVFKGPGFVYDPQGRVVVSPTNGYPLASTDKVVYGNAQPKYVAGITNNISWKGFNFGFVFDFRKGGLIYSGTADLQYFVGNAVQTTYNGRQPFIVPNSVAGVQDPATGAWTYSENTTAITMSGVTDYYYHTTSTTTERARVLDRSYVKLRELTLSYNLPKSLLQKMPIKTAEIGLYGRNLLIWTPVGNNFIDPETTSFGNDLAGEFGEFRSSPTVRSMGFSVKLSF